jgi:GntR family transcriptional regulator
MTRTTDAVQPDLNQWVSEIGIDPASPTPLYMQVRSGLARLIKEGRFGADVALPSERLLAEMLGISRITTRKAIDELASDGLIVRRHGSGNYIAPKLEQPLNHLSSFTEELRQRGFVPTSRWIQRGTGIVLREEMIALGLSPGASVARLERVRLADDTPMAYELSTLPTSVVPLPEAVTHSLYAYLAKREMLPVRAIQHIRAANASPRHAQLLAVPPGQALLWITRVGYVEDGQAVEITHTWCRSDYYDFVVELRR